MVITGLIRFENGNYLSMALDLRQLRALHAGGEKLAQSFGGLPALIFDVLWVDIVDTWGLAYPQPFDGQLNITHSEVTR